MKAVVALRDGATATPQQLRRHCAEVLGTPIVGDKAYGGEDAGSGLFLAAVELQLEHPERAGEPIHATCETPRKFGELLRRESERWQRLHCEQG